MQISSVSKMDPRLRGALGVQTLNPVQEKAVNSGLLELDSSFVVAAPTASGKTLIAEMFMVQNIFEKKTKAVYIVPLKALASEKLQSFKEKYEKLGLRVAQSTGDLDSADRWLDSYDIIILTSEKMDSLMRHSAPWIEKIGVAVIDEVHLINDPMRGPTLEMTITKLRHLNPETLFLFLSATIKNSRELAGWINGKLVQSDWRPVKLHEGVYDGENINFLEKESQKMGSEKPGEILISIDTVKRKKQALIFASTRKNAESIAENSGKYIFSLLLPDEKKELEKTAARVENALDYPTKQCRRAAQCIRAGAAFHHAGLVAKQRKEIEDAFRAGLIKIISSTPTLAAGMNLPAFRVLIRDSKRYYANYGYIHIPVLEYEQMRGRAGRPQFDKEGESILIAKNKREAEELTEKFVLSETEEIYSKLAAEPVLRMHILALAAGGIIKTSGELERFLSSTFYGYQFPDEYALKERVDSIIKELNEWRFLISIGEKLHATRIGRRVSELYIDPESAHMFVEALESGNITHFGLLHLISNAHELYPQLKVHKRDIEGTSLELYKREKELLLLPPEEWESDFEEYLDSIKTALFFENWTKEAGEEFLDEKFGIKPGELYSKKEIANWLLFAVNEICKVLRKKEALKEINKTRLRVKHGIKAELLPLIKLKGVGRVRARKLYSSGFKDLGIVRRAPVAALYEILGTKLADKVKEQVTGSAV